MLTALIVGCAIIIVAFLLLRSQRRAGRIDRGYGTAPRKETGGPGGQPDFSEFPCGHPRIEEENAIRVFGFAVPVRHETLCDSCLEAFLNKYSTRCASCEGPILPGTPVGQAWSGAKYPHTHLMDGCCDTGGLYCGIWGQGRLVTLHELKPEKYPPGTATVMSHAFTTGGVVVENIED